MLSDSYPGARKAGGQYPQTALSEHLHCNPNLAALHSHCTVRNITGSARPQMGLSCVFLDDGREGEVKKDTRCYQLGEMVDHSGRSEICPQEGTAEAAGDCKP